MKIPPPKDWEEFEDITLSALQLRWDSPNLQRHGRQRQPQFGVDIYGDDNLGQLVGVQCKLVSGGTLPLETVEQEVLKAENFEPRLACYYVATTASRDATLQREVRLLSKSRTSQGKFPVDLLFWEDIVAALGKDPREFKKHFPNLALDMGGMSDIGQKVRQPDKTMVVLPIGSQTWWHMGTKGGLPAMQIVARFRVTNVSDWPVHVHSVLLKAPAWETTDILMRWPEENRVSTFPIPPRATLVVLCDFWVQPPTLDPGTPLTSDVALVDQFGNEHWSRNVAFEYMGPAPQPTSQTGPSISELGARERSVIDIIVAHYLATDAWVPGRTVRIELQRVGRNEVDRVLDSCVPQWLRRGGDRPNETYQPTLAGLLASRDTARVSAFTERMLTYLKTKVQADPAFSAFTSEELQRHLSLTPVPDVTFMCAVIRSARLSNGGGGNTTGFRWNVPRDIEDIIACEDVNALVALRAQDSP